MTAGVEADELAEGIGAAKTSDVTVLALTESRSVTNTYDSVAGAGVKAATMHGQHTADAEQVAGTETAQTKGAWPDV